MVVKNVLSFWRQYEYKNKLVLIIGGSRGLGLEIARLLSAEQTKLVLVARDQTELLQAREMLNLPEDQLVIKACGNYFLPNNASTESISGHEIKSNASSFTTASDDTTKRKNEGIAEHSSAKSNVQPA